MTDQERVAKRLEAAERALTELRTYSRPAYGNGPWVDCGHLTATLDRYDAAIAALEPSLLEVAKEVADAIELYRFHSDAKNTGKSLATHFDRLRAAIEREEAKQR